MKKIVWCFIETFLVIATNSGLVESGFGQGSRGMITVKPSQDMVGKFYDNSYALVIGIDNYLNASHLKYATNDAKSVAGLLESQFGFNPQNVISLFDNKASRRDIMLAFDRLKRVSKKNDRIFVFYAGHGVTEALPDGREKGYILPYDADTGDLLTTAISTDQLNEISQVIAAKHLFFVMDACYGGLIFSRAAPLSPSAVDYLEVISTRVARKALTAGGMDQTVLDTGPGGHSVFTFNFIDGLKSGAADLNGDGMITSGELNEYIAPRVTAASSGAQTPEYGILAGDRGGDFVFIPEGAIPHIMNESVVSVKANVDSVFVFVDNDSSSIGLLTASGGNVLNVPLSPGEHTLRVSKEGFIASEKNVTVNAGENQNLEFALEEASATLDIISNVDSAEVIIDSVSVGMLVNKELKISKPVGRYAIELHKYRYASTSQVVNLSNDGTQKVSFNLTPVFSELHIHSDPSDDSIYVDGRLAGVGNVSAEVDKGQIGLRIVREGYKTFEKQIRISQDRTDLNYSLEPRLGSVMLASNPAGAEVYVDNLRKGSTPVVVRDLRFGKHEVQVHKVDYQDISLVVDVNSEQPMNEYLELKLTYEAQAHMIYESRLSAKSEAAWLTGIAAVGAGGAAYFFNSKANQSYDNYTSATTPNQINTAWNDYRQKLSYRNYAYGAAAGFGILCIYNIARGVSYDEIFDEVRKGDISLRIDDNNGFKGVRISFNF